MSGELETLKSLLDEKVLKILDIFVNSDEEFYLRELASKAGVPPATTYRIINKLLDLKIIEKTEIKNLKIYKLSTTKQAEFLKRTLYSKLDPLDLFIEEIKKIYEVSQVVMHAKPQKTGAFVLVVGDVLPIIKINDLAEKIEREHDFKIKILPLQNDQYEMLDSTHSGYKKSLYRR